MLPHSERGETRLSAKSGPPLRGCALQPAGRVASIAGATSPCCTPRLANGLQSAIPAVQNLVVWL